MDTNFSATASNCELSLPLFIEVAINGENSLAQQLEFLLSEPLRIKIEEETQTQKIIKNEGTNIIKEKTVDTQISEKNKFNNTINIKDIKYSGKNNSSLLNNKTSVPLTKLKIKESDEILLKKSMESDNDNRDKDVKLNLTCRDCYETFDTKEIYDIHISGHVNNMKCAICNMVLKSLKNYEKHCLRCKPYECQICGRVVRFRPNFIKHMRVHTGQQSQRHKYKCEVCQKEFMSFEYFKVHKKIHNENVNLTCDVCGKVFSALASLRGHSKLHTGIKLHKCGVCGKGFGQRYNLKIHSRVHTGELPYVCTVCKKKMHTQSSYRNHIQTHQKDQESQTSNENQSSKYIESKKEKNNNVINKNNNYTKIVTEKTKTERETQTVVQNINDKLRVNKCFVIPGAVISDIFPKNIICNDNNDTLLNNYIIEAPSDLNNIKNDTNSLFKLNSNNPKINEVNKNNSDIGDDDDDDDDEVININTSIKLSTVDSDKFHSTFSNNHFINSSANDSDDDLMSNSLPSYSNIFESSNLISNSITADIYLNDCCDIDDDDSFTHNLQSTILKKPENATLTQISPTLSTNTTTDGNFIKKEWVYSNTISTNNYSSISKFSILDEDNENGFCEARSFIYDD